ncbi:MAG TPA: hypothetical protein VLM37_12630, partial [Fibrobacteraceae bacterium]|nr:hypothetical protein [Fibrobacteraceae bacterium]
MQILNAQTPDSSSFPALLEAPPSISSPPQQVLSPVDSGDTAWVLMATALVFLMTAPGLALFYGGLVRRKNILSVLMQCMGLVFVLSLLWVFFGYSLAFGPDIHGFIGSTAW